MIPVAILLMVITCALSNRHEFLDLSYGFDDESIAFPGGVPFHYLKRRAGPDPNGVWYSSNDFATAEHCGTHLDAPYHFHKEGKKVGEIDLRRLITTGFHVNASLETAGNSQYKLPKSKLIEWEKENGEIKNNSVLLVSFGWASRYPNRTEYLGPSDEDLRYPGLSAEAAQWIVDTKKIVGVGVDTPSVDQSINTEAHVILNSNDIYILENVNMNYDVPPKFGIVVMPMKLMNGTGAPCRIVAIVPQFQ